MLDQFIFDDMTFTWLDGGNYLADGGTHFGPVPRALWGRHFPYNEDNLIPQVADPILIQYQGKHYLIDTGMSTLKMSEKEQQHMGIQSKPRVLESLETLGLTAEDIDVVLMTHMHNDHASGLTLPSEDGYRSTFSNAIIYMTAIEWDEVRYPNRRTQGTYLKENWEAIEEQVQTFDKVSEIIPGITMEHTGGHSRGHAMIRFEQASGTVFLLADILLTSAQTNPLWVGGVDDYPMDSIKAKEKYLTEALEGGYRIIFYHDPFFRMLKYTPDGKGYTECLRPQKKALVEVSSKQDKWLEDKTSIN